MRLCGFACGLSGGWDRWDGWDGLLGTLATFPSRLVVAESDRPLDAAGWEVVGVNRHGGTVVTQLRPRGAIAT